MDIPREWTFENTDVASGFDRHVREQLPWYDLVTGAVAHIARHYIPKDGLVYDIGASAYVVADYQPVNSHIHVSLPLASSGVPAPILVVDIPTAAHGEARYLLPMPSEAA